jgi:2-polyprenyl-6-hydroxyphenyl methylase/3-demethylubiquinone-9 3-methyltransferase
MDTTQAHKRELAAGERFAFGENWARFLGSLTDSRVADAEDSVRVMLGVESLSGKSFLDVGSGSGLFSLAAHRLGARVVSFDYDPQSVACTNELRQKFSEAARPWEVKQGSVLDAAFVSSLGKFDVVYSWGVLHHTGSMWEALDNAMKTVAIGGQMFIALYNDQGSISRYWTWVKRVYNKHRWTRPFWIGLHGLYPVLPGVLLKTLKGRKSPRGMSAWYDLIDWLGGFPFEVASPAQVHAFCRDRGFRLERERLVARKMGCNEFVFRRESD